MRGYKDHALRILRGNANRYRSDSIRMQTLLPNALLPKPFFYKLSTEHLRNQYYEAMLH